MMDVAVILVQNVKSKKNLWPVILQFEYFYSVSKSNAKKMFSFYDIRKRDLSIHRLAHYLSKSLGIILRFKVILCIMSYMRI